ncbi:hypothetical protein [Streptomyces sp. 11-1-2]|uniref:hypothetical protein n=1 Tax=unclassified Streptomyces TaxID=2593676 RepID=UPI001F095B80|nr:hypothetical protein [Streptomyces sp. 11-1-2]
MLRLSVLLAAVGSCCFLLADDPVWLSTGRVGHALALGAATGAAQALITRHRGPTARIAGPLLASPAFAAGTAAGPVASGLLAQYAPGTLTTPYGLHLALLAWVWHRLSRTVPAPTATPGGGARRRWRPTRPHLPPALRSLILVAGLPVHRATASPATPCSGPRERRTDPSGAGPPAASCRPLPEPATRHRHRYDDICTRPTVGGPCTIPA